MELLDVRAFNFWDGEGDCEFDGEILRENVVIDAPQTWHGTSVSVFHPKLHVWQQTCVDQGGAYWHIIGQLVDADPAFATPTPVDESSLHTRTVFADITTDSFERRWKSSPDEHTSTENRAISYSRRA